MARINYSKATKPIVLIIYLISLKIVKKRH